MPEPREVCDVQCIWCGERWSPEMWAAYEQTSDGCDSCGYGAEGEVTVEITCTNCWRVVYRKTVHY